MEKKSQLMVALFYFGLDSSVLAAYFSQVITVCGSLRRLGYVDFLLGLQLPLVW